MTDKHTDPLPKAKAKPETVWTVRMVRGLNDDRTGLIVSTHVDVMVFKTRVGAHKHIARLMGPEPVQIVLKEVPVHE